MKMHHVIVMCVCAFFIYMVGVSYPNPGNRVLSTAGM